MSHPALNASHDHDACGVGFIAQLGGEATRDVLERALVALGRLSHRGGVDADGLSGDGAGLLLPIPRVFFRVAAQQARIDLPEIFGVGMAFIGPASETEARAVVEKCAADENLRCLGWRGVPTEPSILGPRAASTLPLIRQCFFAPSASPGDFEPSLFLPRKRIESEARGSIY